VPLRLKPSVALVAISAIVPTQAMIGEAGTARPVDD
jgi:hypothetical protein